MPLPFVPGSSPDDVLSAFVLDEYLTQVKLAKKISHRAEKIILKNVSFMNFTISKKPSI